MTSSALPHSGRVRFITSPFTTVLVVEGPRTLVVPNGCRFTNVYTPSPRPPYQKARLSLYLPVIEEAGSVLFNRTYLVFPFEKKRAADILSKEEPKFLNPGLFGKVEESRKRRTPICDFGGSRASL